MDVEKYVIGNMLIIVVYVKINAKQKEIIKQI